MLVVYGHKFNWWKTIAKQNTHAGLVAQDRLNYCSNPTGLGAYGNAYLVYIYDQVEVGGAEITLSGIRV